MKWILLYLIVMNLLSYGSFAIDKKRAVKKQWRIPELRLILLAFVGGGIGAWRGMMDYRHKTNKFKFRFLIPLFSLLQMIVLVYLGWRSKLTNDLGEWQFFVTIFFVQVILFAILHFSSKVRKV